MTIRKDRDIIIEKLDILSKQGYGVNQACKELSITFYFYKRYTPEDIKDRLCKNGWKKSEDTKEKMSKAAIKREANKTEEQKQEISKKLIKARAEYNANVTPEEKERNRLHCIEISKNYHANVTEEEKKIINQKKSEAKKLWHQTRPEEVEQERREKLRQAAIKQQKNMTPEQRELISAKQSASQLDRYANMTLEEREYFIQSIKDSKQNMSQEDYDAMCNHLKEAWTNKSEEELKEFSQKLKDSWTEERRGQYSKQQTEREANKTPEEKQEISKKISKAIKKSYTPERRQRASEIAAQKAIDPNNLFGSGQGIYAEYKNTGIYMRSGWERKFAEQLDTLGIIWKYEKSISYKKNDTIYTCLPDFYFPEINTIIEIRPTNFLHRGGLVNKVRSLRKLGYCVLICTEKNWDSIINKLCNMNNSSQAA